MMEERSELRLAAVAAKCRRAAARGEIESLFGRYTYLQAQLLDAEIPALFAQKTEGVRVRRVGYGVMHGLEGVKKLYNGKNPRYRGRMNVHAALGPIIEVAQDGQTAKGLWFLDGEECCPYPGDPDPAVDPMEPYLSAPDRYGVRKYVHWVWNKVGADFVLEDGVWKLWHMTDYELMRCPFDEDWISWSITRQAADLKTLNLRPREDQEPCASPMMPAYDEPEYSPYRCYTIAEPPCTELRPPEPYGTFDETFSY